MSSFIKAAGDIIGGIQDFQDAKREKKDIKKQAGVAMREGEADAERIAAADKRRLQLQTQSFLKSGVRLEGSALQVLKETQSESNDFVNAFRESTRTKAAFTRDKGKRVLTQGRRKFVAASFSAGANVVKGMGA